MTGATILTEPARGESMNAQNDWGRRRFLQTLTAGFSLLPAAAPSEVSSNLSREKCPALMAPPDSSGKTSPPIFDPLLDPRCRQLPGAKVDSWPAHWIWYPGQLTAHLHAKTLQASMARCAQVGYPSSFRQPLSFAYFRIRTAPDSANSVCCAGPNNSPSSTRPPLCLLLL